MLRSVLNALSKWTLELDYDSGTGGAGGGGGGGGAGGAPSSPGQHQEHQHHARSHAIGPGPSPGPRAGPSSHGSRHPENAEQLDDWVLVDDFDDQQLAVAAPEVRFIASVGREYAGHGDSNPVVLLDQDDLGLSPELREFATQLASFRDTWTMFPLEKLEVFEKSTDDDAASAFTSTVPLLHLYKKDLLSAFRVGRWHARHAAAPTNPAGASGAVSSGRSTSPSADNAVAAGATAAVDGGLRKSASNNALASSSPKTASSKHVLPTTDRARSHSMGGSAASTLLSVPGGGATRSRAATATRPTAPVLAVPTTSYQNDDYDTSSSDSGSSDDRSVQPNDSANDVIAPTRGERMMRQRAQTLESAGGPSSHREGGGAFPSGAAANRYADQRFLSDLQETHAREVLRLVPELAGLRFELCPESLTEEYFWRVYFALVSSRVGDCLGTVRPRQKKAQADQSTPEQPPRCSLCEGAGGDALFMALVFRVVANRNEQGYKASKQPVIQQLLKNRDKTHRFWLAAAPKIVPSSSQEHVTIAQAVARVRRGVADADRDLVYLLLASVFREDNRTRESDRERLSQLLENANAEFSRTLALIDYNSSMAARESSLANLVDRLPTLLNTNFNFSDHFLSRRGRSFQKKILAALCAETVSTYAHDRVDASPEDIQKALVDAVRLRPCLLLAPDVVACMLLFLEPDLTFATARRLFIADADRRDPLEQYCGFPIDCFPVALWYLIQAHVPKLYVFLTETLFLDPTHPDLFEHLGPWFSRCFFGSMPFQTALRILDCGVCPDSCQVPNHRCECNNGDVVVLEASLAFMSFSQDHLMLTKTRSEFWGKVKRFASQWHDGDGLVRVRKNERMAREAGTAPNPPIGFVALMRLETDDALTRARLGLLPQFGNVSSLLSSACGRGEKEVQEVCGALWSRLPPRFQLKSPTLLFRASQDGFNLRTLASKCAQRAPTILLVRTDRNVVCGALLAVPWIDLNPSSYGTRPPSLSSATAETMLFQLLPEQRRSFHRWTPGADSTFLNVSLEFGIEVGASGLRIDPELLNGSSGPSSTFKSCKSIAYAEKPAKGTPKTAVSFKCLDIEVFAL